MPKRTIAKRSLDMTGLFEAELLTELLLRQWNHPLASDADFRMGVLESASEILRSCTHGNMAIEGLPASETNLVAAIWAAESTTISSDLSIPEAERILRFNWLEGLRRSIPSCFCSQELLDDSPD